MKKQLPTDDIANDLETSSVFFRQAEADSGTQEPADAGNAARRQADQSCQPDTVALADHATTPPRHHATMTPSDGGATVSSIQDIMDDPIDEGELRRAVRLPGREAATYRFSADEKQRLADIVYTYQRQRVRTSENEITRIAVNWLLMDYQKNGANSVLVRMLDVLHG